MSSAWRCLLAPCSLCAACAVYDAALLDGGPVGAEAGAASGSAAGAPGTGAEAPGSGGTQQTGHGAAGAHAAEPGDGGGDASAAGAAAGAGAGGEEPAGAAGASPQGGAHGGGVTTPGGSGGAAEQAIELVDDFETADVYGLYVADRAPLWYLMNDGTLGVQEPEPLVMTELPAADSGTAPGSTSALYVSSSGFTSWGSGVGVDLSNASGKETYDLSEYVGISFWARVPGSYRLVRVNLPDVGTDPSGEICGDACSDHFGKSITLSSEWKRYEIPFSALTQMGWGFERERLTVEAVYSIHFQIASGKDVELWIDELGLVLP